MWVVMLLQRFEMQVAGPLLAGIPAHLSPDEKMVGYLPVYETLEDAKADFPNGNVVEIREGA